MFYSSMILSLMIYTTDFIRYMLMSFISQIARSEEKNMVWKSYKISTNEENKPTYSK